MTRRFAARHWLLAALLSLLLARRSPPATPTTSTPPSRTAPAPPSSSSKSITPAPASASISLAAGATFHYRFQVRGSGPLKLSYTAADGKQVQITGPTLAERQQGQLEIVLLPGGKAEFHPQLTPNP